MEPDVIRLKDFSDGIDFYMLTKQFQRVASKMEECHDFMLSKDCDPVKAGETLKYFENERSLLFQKMKAILDRAV